MNSFEQEIAEALAATGSFEKEAALKLISVPPDTTHGNFTIPCFSLAKTLRKAPKLIAEDLAAQVNRELIEYGGFGAHRLVPLQIDHHIMHSKQSFVYIMIAENTSTLTL